MVSRAAVPGGPCRTTPSSPAATIKRAPIPGPRDNTVLKTIKARFTGGTLVPLEPVDFAEGDELLVTLQEPESISVEAEDAGLAQAIVQGLSTEPVSKQRVLDALQARDGA